MNSKNGKNATQLMHKARDEFYERARRETGLTENEIREVLLEHYQSFNLLQVEEYIKLLKEVGRERREQQALLNRRTKLRNRINKPIPPEPCPIEGCTGHKTAPARGESWAWVCSEGGLHHFLVDSVSHTLHISHKDFEIKLTGAKNDTAEIQSITKSA